MARPSLEKGVLPPLGLTGIRRRPPLRSGVHPVRSQTASFVLASLWAIHSWAPWAGVEPAPVCNRRAATRSSDATRGLWRDGSRHLPGPSLLSDVSACSGVPVVRATALGHVFGRRWSARKQSSLRHSGTCRKLSSVGWTLTYSPLRNTQKLGPLFSPEVGRCSQLSIRRLPGSGLIVSPDAMPRAPALCFGLGTRGALYLSIHSVSSVRDY